MRRPSTTYAAQPIEVKIIRDHRSRKEFFLSFRQGANEVGMWCKTARAARRLRGKVEVHAAAILRRMSEA